VTPKCLIVAWSRTPIEPSPCSVDQSQFRLQDWRVQREYNKKKVSGMSPTGGGVAIKTDQHSDNSGAPELFPPHADTCSAHPYLYRFLINLYDSDKCSDGKENERSPPYSFLTL
jgi:hypothetical protein